MFVFRNGKVAGLRVRGMIFGVRLGDTDPGAYLDRASERSVQLDHHDGVVAEGFRVRARSRLRVAVNDDWAGDARQSRGWPDGVRACARNIEGNSVSARVCIGCGDRVAQSALSVITNACAGVSRRVDDE